MLSPHPPSFCPFDPPNCQLSCSPILNPYFDVHEEQVLYGVGVEHPTYDIIFDDYMWQPIVEPESMMKDDSSPSTHLPHYPDIFHNMVIPIKYFEESISNHS